MTQTSETEAAAPLSPYFKARDELLNGPMRDRELGFRDVRRAGWALGGDPRDLGIFGLSPPIWYSCGIRMIGRTAVEMTRDFHAEFIGKSVAETLRPFGAIPDVIDAFTGSGNLLYHVARALKARRLVGLDVTAEVMDRTKKNFSRLRMLGKVGLSRVELHQQDWENAVSHFQKRPSLFILAPPWGEAFTEKGLDLGKTTPPVGDILDNLSRRVKGAPSFALVQTHPRMIKSSLDAIAQRYSCFPSKHSEDPKISERVDYLLLKLAD
jgi:hypothetical protein